MNTNIRRLCTILLASLLLAGIPFLPTVSANATWVRQETGTTAVLHGISGVDASHVWAVGSDNTILFYNGSSWAQQSNPGGVYYAVYALDNSHVWAAGYDGLISFFNGSVWEDQNTNDNMVFSGVYAADAEHVWAVGGSGRIYSYDGSSWQVQHASSDIYAFEAVSGTDKDHVWAVGGKNSGSAFVGACAYFDGASWTEVETGAPHTLFGVFAQDTTHVWAVGGGGEIQFFNGASWSAQPTGTDETIEGVGAYSASGAFAVSEGGKILAYNGSSWSEEQSGTTNRLTHLFALDKDHQWACGDQGIILSRQPVQPPPFAPTARTWGHDSIGIPEAATNWYLAEGCTGGGFETWVLVQNPNTSPAQVNITYMTSSGLVPGPSETLGANSRKTYDVSSVVPNNWEVSTRVQSSIPVIAERAMYGGNRTWGHDSIGANEASTTWYLAEGSTGPGFETWVLVQNPNKETARVNLTYMTTGGRRQGPETDIPGNSRKTFNVADTVPGQFEVSTMVGSDRPVIAERAMYGPGRTWGHDSIGVSGPAKYWFLAEGCTGEGFETWVLVQNPNAEAAEVHLTYMTESGPVEGPTATVGADSRMTFDARKDVPNKFSVSTLVAGDKPVIAERAMYGGNRAWGHDSIGTIAPNTTWYLAEGSTGAGFETWVLVQNPNADDVQVTLTYMTKSGRVDGPSVTVSGESRTTFNVASTLSGEWEISTMVTATKPVIAERAMYGNTK